MLEYFLAGLALGSIYALAAAGITVTYVSTGILNFAFGSFAYFLARTYYWLNSQLGWPILPSALVTLLVIAPALGAFLYVVLLRHLRRCSTLVQIVATIGLFVAMPPLALVLFGNQTINAAPGLSPQPEHVFHVFGAAVSLDQVIAYAFLVGVVALGTVVLRFTDIGLRVRALVSTRALASLSGINPFVISISVWMIATALAGLTGVLAAPSMGLTPDGMTSLMSAAFAAVIAARLRSLPVTVIVALLMGVVTDMIQEYLPASSTYTAGIVQSVPFVVTALAFLYFYARHGAVRDITGGGSLDAAVEPQGGAGAALAKRTQAAVSRSQSVLSFGSVGSVVVFIIIALLPLMFSGYWLTLIAGAFVYGVIFLSFTLVLGEGGFLWLCMISFSGLGAVIAAQFATVAGWPPLLAVIVAAVIVTPVGILLSLLTTRFGELYVALATLTFGLLVETLVFTSNRFLQDGIGVPMPRPGWAAGDRPFAYLVLAIFAVIAVFVINMRRSTTGLALSSARRSEAASTSVLGLGVVSLRVLICSLATFVAALGGGLLAMYSGTALPPDFTTYAGLAWLAVLVTIGVRSIVAAVAAGLAFTVVPGLFATYLPSGWGNLPTILFGVGAIGLVMAPDGSVTTIARQFETLFSRIRPGRTRDPAAAPALYDGPGEVTELAGSPRGGQS
jgi:branched-chain amino acid transport system permease protein